MLNKFVIFTLSLFIFNTAYSQISVSPNLPTASAKVTITFDSSKESRLGAFSGDLYAHTGVILEGSSDWQHVIGNWGDNSVQPKLTNSGDGIYLLEIEPNINTFYGVESNEKVTQLAFVFRSSDASSQTNDLFIDVYEEGLIVSISSPSNNAILEKNVVTAISANSSQSGTIGLYVNENLLQETEGTEISVNHTFTESGLNYIIGKVEVGNETAYDSILVLVKDEVQNITMPSGLRKGINYISDSSVTLSLFAPEKEYVFVMGDFNNWLPSNDYLMKKDQDNFWLTIDSLEKGKSYIFQYYIDGDIKIADPFTEQTSDPWNDQYIEENTYPGLVEYPSGKTTGIASVLQTGQEEYKWEATDFQIPSKDQLIIYEMLIRDFTEEHSFQSVIDRLDYLEDLHVNVLELMPVNEFEGNSSWGYNPSFYFAPDKYYGPKNELKKLIDECHKRGIAVVIDMVLNHSYSQSPLVQMYWNEQNSQPSDTNPWYNEQSNFQNPDAQWGYDFNHEITYTKELVDSVNSYWMNEYNIDGFRFDFTKGFSNTTYGPSSWGSSYDTSRIKILKRMANEIWERKENALVIFEHLSDNDEETELANYGILLWGNMNHNYGEAAMAYTENEKSDISWGVYSERGWDEANLVSYMESHDEERITYKLQQFGNSGGDYNTKDLSTALDRMELNSLFFIPLPGPKMIWQMGELGYDFSIDYNGRLGEKPVKWDYLNVKDRTDLFKVVSKLNFLKQTYSEFQSGEFSFSLADETKWYRFSHEGNHVVAVGNFSTSEKQISVTFPETGNWHNYFGESTFVVSTNETNITLEAGEYMLLSSREFEHPQIVTHVSDAVTESNIKVFPNPANERIWIESKLPIEGAAIHSLDGRLLQRVNLSGKTRAVVNLKAFSAGFYILQVQSGEQAQTFSFVKK